MSENDWHIVLPKVKMQEVDGHCFHLVQHSVSIGLIAIDTYECCRCTDSCTTQYIVGSNVVDVVSSSTCQNNRTEYPKEWEDEDFTYQLVDGGVEQYWNLEGLCRYLTGRKIEGIVKDEGLVFNFDDDSYMVINRDGIWYRDIKFPV